MRRILGLACLSALASTSGASAQGITLFGDARLGLGYNITNGGEPALVDGGEADGVVTSRTGDDDLRAISRVRFGLRMVGESDSGVNFGAEIRADNAQGGQGDPRNGQTAGDVFVTGDLGTLTYGDTAGADYARVGDPIANVSLTGLGDFYELPFLSNGGGSDNDALQFITDPEARPTVRYDYDFAAFGVSLSTNRALNDVAVGARYHREFSDGFLSVGVGYYDFAAFEGEFLQYGAVDVPSGDQVSASVTGRVGRLSAGVGFTQIDAGDAGKLDVLTVGGGARFGAWEVTGYYSAVTDGRELLGAAFDGRDSYGASASYDLGGGATVNAGVARTYGADAVGAPGDRFAPAADATTLADFGIRLNF